MFFPVLLQQQGNSWKSVSYTFRSMTETECCYAQIEEETLVTIWACEKNHELHPGYDRNRLVPLIEEKTWTVCCPKF